jgi:hypothetical protein
MALIGSGGRKFIPKIIFIHKLIILDTTEMIKLLSSVLDGGNNLFPIRIYVLTNTDSLSREKVLFFFVNIYK